MADKIVNCNLAIPVLSRIVSKTGLHQLAALSRVLGREACGD